MNRPSVVVAISAGMGFVVGAAFATFHQAVEFAQVTAGIVEYPSNNTFHYFQTHGWSLTVQLSGVLLRMGVTERLASILLSGALGVFWFVSASLLTFALSRNWMLGLLSPLVMFGLYFDVIPDGVSYPVYLMSFRQTFGVAGLLSSLLTLSLIAAGCKRAGAFFLGLGFSLHLPSGLWMFGATAAAACILRTGWRTLLREYALFFAIGASISAASYALQLSVAAPWPPVVAETA